MATVLLQNLSIDASKPDTAPEGDDDTDPGSASAPNNADRPDAGSSPAATLQVDINWLAEPIDSDLKQWLQEQLARIATLAGVVGGGISLAVVGDGQMAELHEQYKNVPGTTDVLSFDLLDGSGDGHTVDAELIVCIDEAARQAEARGHSVRMELLLYAVHGLLHMLDYDDSTEGEALRMHRREDELLKEAGFKAVYGD